MNVTFVLNVIDPTVAWMLFVSAFVDASVAVKTPLVFVVPLAGVSVFCVPDAVSDTAWFGTGMLFASRIVTVMVDSAVPFATTDVGFAEIVDVACDGAPGPVSSTASFAASFTPASASAVASTPVLVSDAASSPASD
jgi:hypothetical protein